MKSREIPHSVRELGSKIGEQVHKLGNPFKPKSLATNVGVLQIGISRGPKTTETIYPPYTDDAPGGIEAAPVEEEEVEEIRRTAQDVEEGRYAPGKTQGFVEKLASNWAVLGSATVVAAGSLAYATVPEVRRFVDAQAHNLLTKINWETTVPETFDNKADKGVIGGGNTISLPLSEIQQALPTQVVERDNDFTMLFPFTTPPGTVVKYEKSLAERFATNQIREDAQQKDIKDHADFILPKDATIIAPASGNVLVMEGIDNKQMSLGARFFHYDQKTDTTYVIWIFALDINGRRTYLQPLTQVQPLGAELWSGEKWKNLPKTEQGTSLLKTTEDNQPVRISINAYKGQKVGLEAAVNDKSLYVVTPQFLTEEENGQQKIVVLEQ